MEKLAVSVTEAARLTSLSKSMVYALIERGLFPFARVGEKRIIIPVRSLQSWIEKQHEVGKYHDSDQQLTKYQEKRICRNASK